MKNIEPPFYWQQNMAMSEGVVESNLPSFHRLTPLLYGDKFNTRCGNLL